MLAAAPHIGKQIDSRMNWKIGVFVRYPSRSCRVGSLMSPQLVLGIPWSTFVVCGEVIGDLLFSSNVVC